MKGKSIARDRMEGEFAKLLETLQPSVGLTSASIIAKLARGMAGTAI